MTFSRASSRFKFSQYFKEFHKALDDEIRQLRKGGGQRTYLSQGIFLNKRSSGKCIYSFTADSELRFPDDTPIELELRKAGASRRGKQTNTVAGALASTDGFDIILALDKKLPQDKIHSAALITSPIFLLEELKKRLQATGSNSAKKYHLSTLLLNPDANTEVDRTGEAAFLLLALEKRLGKAIQRNECQEAAVDHVLSHRAGFIWGPPGTGKTTTLGMSVASLSMAGESVLVLAHSNMAVDTAMKSVAQHIDNLPIYKEGLAIRFGTVTGSVLQNYPMLRAKKILEQQHPSLINEIKTLRNKRKSLNQKIKSANTTPYHRKQLDAEVERLKKPLSQLNARLKAEENKLVKKAEIVGCTLSKAMISPEIFQRQFDAVIIDEASMISIPHCVFASTLAERRIAIFGDFRQLEPISQSETKEAKDWLKRDIFEQAGITTLINRGHFDVRMVQLQTQYRMHPKISAIPNQLCYNNSLRDGVNVAEQTEKIAQKHPYPGHPIVLYDLSQVSAFCIKEKESHSRFNLISALLAANLAHQAVVADTDTSVGLITPYNAQSRLLHRILQDIACSKQIKASTVHRFQGSEQNVIVFDAVDSAPEQVSLLLKGGMQSTAMRLANVAISRAQGKFIGLLNTQYIHKELSSQFNFFAKFTHCLEKASFIEKLSWEAFNRGEHTFSLPGVTYFQNRNSARQALEDDLKSAGESADIYWPRENFKQYVDFDVFTDCNRQGLGIHFSGEAGEVEKLTLENHCIWSNGQTTSMGFIGFDRKLLWVALNPSSSNAMMLRIALPKTVDLLYTFLTLNRDSRSGSMAGKLREHNYPLGTCLECSPKQPLWFDHRFNTSFIGCMKVPHHGRRRIKPDDATRLADFMRKTCDACHAKLVGRRSTRDSSVFLVCTASNCGKISRVEDLM